MIVQVEYLNIENIYYILKCKWNGFVDSRNYLYNIFWPSALNFYQNFNLYQIVY